MSTYDQLKSNAAVIRDATLEKENTAWRVGSVLLEIIAAIDNATPIEAIDASTIAVEKSETDITITYGVQTEDGTMHQDGISIPLATENNAGLISPELYAKLLNAVETSTLNSRIDEVLTAVDATDQDVAQLQTSMGQNNTTDAAQQAAIDANTKNIANLGIFVFHYICTDIDADAPAAAVGEVVYDSAYGFFRQKTADGWITNIKYNAPGETPRSDVLYKKDNTFYTYKNGKFGALVAEADIATLQPKALVYRPMAGKTRLKVSSIDYENATITFTTKHNRQAGDRGYGYIYPWNQSTALGFIDAKVLPSFLGSNIGFCVQEVVDEYTVKVSNSFFDESVSGVLSNVNPDDVDFEFFAIEFVADSSVSITLPDDFVGCPLRVTILAAGCADSQGASLGAMVAGVRKSQNIQNAGLSLTLFYDGYFGGNYVTHGLRAINGAYTDTSEYGSMWTSTHPKVIFVGATLSKDTRVLIEKL